MDLTTLSSLRVCWTLKTVVKCKFFMWPIDPFVTSCVSDAQNVLCGQMQVLELAEQPFHHFVREGRSKLWYDANLSFCAATFSSLRACRTLKTEVKCKFWTWPMDPFVISCVSDIQKCGKMQVFHRTEPDYGRKLW